MFLLWRVRTLPIFREIQSQVCKNSHFATVIPGVNRPEQPPQCRSFYSHTKTDNWYLKDVLLVSLPNFSITKQKPFFTLCGDTSFRDSRYMALHSVSTPSKQTSYCY